MSNRPDAADRDSPGDDDLLYRRLQPNWVRGRDILPAAAQVSQWKQGLSCDWSVLARPEDTAKGEFPSYVLIIPVSECRRLGIEVRYDPIDDPSDPNFNPAHCLLFLPSNAKTKAEKARVRDGLLSPKATTWRLLDPPWHRRLWYRLRTWFRGRRKPKAKSAR